MPRRIGIHSGAGVINGLWDLVGQEINLSGSCLSRIDALTDANIPR